MDFTLYKINYYYYYYNLQNCNVPFGDFENVHGSAYVQFTPV